MSTRNSPGQRLRAIAVKGIAIALTLIGPAFAEPRRGAPPIAPKIDVKDVGRQIESPETIAAGMEAVIAAGPAAKAVAPAIEALLRKGLPPKIAAEAIVALGAIGESRSSGAIAPYIQHRDAAVRRAAAAALGKTRGAEAGPALLRGLRSIDDRVRALSAASLGTAGDASAAQDLVKALDLGITEAAASIAMIGDEAACRAIVNRKDGGDVGVRRAVLAALLGRKPAMPDDVLMAALAKAGPATTGADRAYFHDLAAAFKGSRKVKKAIEAAARPAKGDAP